MLLASATDLVVLLRQYHLLEPAQLEAVAELQSQFPEARALVTELGQRGWLTPFQVNHLFEGRGAELLLGNYVLLERLGEGGMGIVFKARNWKLGRVVALKVISKERLANPDIARRFDREIQAAAQLNHPNICRAHDAGHTADRHFFVMEYLQGSDLGKVVRQRGPLPVVEACDYIRQAALGLQHAFERGMVHRDIKPANILLVSGGSEAQGLQPLGVGTTRQVKLLDLGLARVQRETEEGATSTLLTREGVVMGTPDFMAPEQSLDSHTVDIRADLYSLGCTLYYLLTARVPFPGGSLGQKLMRHQMREPQPVEQLRPDLPPGLVPVLRKLMAKRPEDRYQTPAELADALAAVVDFWESCPPTQPGGASAGTLSLPLPPEPVKGDTGEAWGALVTPLPTKSPSATQPVLQAAPQRRLRRWLAAGGGVLLLGVGLVSLLLLHTPWSTPKTMTPPPLGDQPGNANTAAPRLRVLVPAYFYPAEAGLKDWERLFTASAQVPVVVVVNPATGPGKEADPQYLKLIDRAKTTKTITLIGYVTTSYGKRPLDEVESDVDRWLRLYPPIGGIFFDEQASGEDKVAYQAELYEYVRTRKALKLVVTNPGTVCSEKYLSQPATDVACLFEGPKPFASSLFPEWVGKYGQAHVAALSYKVGTAEAMSERIQAVAGKQIGYCYVTDAEGDNPWERLPRYWDEEVAAVREANQRPGKP
jgi:serine/threonine-protein kinase